MGLRLRELNYVRIKRLVNSREVTLTSLELQDTTDGGEMLPVVLTRCNPKYAREEVEQMELRLLRRGNRYYVAT